MHTPGPGGEAVFRCLHFDELDTHTLYELLKLRQEVFCVEQNCAYLDVDGKDRLAWHVLGYKNGELVAVARLLMPGEAYPDACAVGRIATRRNVRGEGLGQVLMKRAIEQCQRRFPDLPIRISAQQYLIRFYQDFGFVEQGEGYLEDGIAHIEMVRG